MEAFLPDLEEIQNFGIGTLVIAAGLVAFFKEFSPFSIVALFLTALVAMLVRETGQRLVAQLMNARLTLELSKGGAFATIGAAFIAIVGDAPAIFLLPVYNTFSTEKYEQWGYDIPVAWSKREYWLASTGIVFTLLLAGSAYFLESYVVSRSLSLFAFFQMIPLKDTALSESTDGAYILLHSGFMWLLLTSLAILGIIFPL